MRSLDRHSRRKAGLTTPHKPLKEKPKVKKAAKNEKEETWLVARRNFARENLYIRPL
jgi:hypothetical protein